MDTIEIILEIVVIVVAICVIALLILLFTMPGQNSAKHYQTQKQELFQCLQKTNQDFEWCYGQIIKK